MATDEKALLDLLGRAWAVLDAEEKVSDELADDICDALAGHPARAAHAPQPSQETASVMPTCPATREIVGILQYCQKGIEHGGGHLWSALKPESAPEPAKHQRKDCNDLGGCDGCMPNIPEPAKESEPWDEPVKDCMCRPGCKHNRGCHEFVEEGTGLRICSRRDCLDCGAEVLKTQMHVCDSELTLPGEMSTKESEVERLRDKIKCGWVCACPVDDEDLDAFEAAVRKEALEEAAKKWGRCTHGILLELDCKFCREGR